MGCGGSTNYDAAPQGQYHSAPAPAPAPAPVHGGPRQFGVQQGHIQSHQQAPPPQQHHQPPQQHHQPAPAYNNAQSVALSNGMAINVQFDNGRFLRAQPDGTFDDNADRAAEWERFTLEQAGPNAFGLRTAHGKVLCWDQGENRFEARDAVGDWERFEFRPAGQGKFHVFSPAHNVFIHGGNGIRSSSTPELVAIIPVGGAAPATSHHAPVQSVALSNGMAINVQFDNGRFLRAQPDGTFDDNADRAAEWERFTLEQAGPNAFGLRTAHGKVLCWDQGENRFEARDAIGDWERFEFRPAGQGKFHVFSPAHNVFIHGGNGIRSSSTPELVTIIVV